MKKRILLNVSWLVVSLIILAFLVKFLVDMPFRKQLPPLPDLQNLSSPVREQINEAFKRTRRNPTPENLGNLGMVYHAAVFYEQAARCYQLAVRKSKSGWIWNYYLGYLYREMGESDAALENFNRVIQINPKVFHAWYYAGEEYQNMGNSDQAEKAFGHIANPEKMPLQGKSTTRNDYFPLSVYARFQMAKIYHGTGRIDKAEQTLKEIIENSRSFGPAYRLLGTVYLLKDDSLSGKRFMVRANDLAAYAPPVDTLVDKLMLLSRSALYLLKNIDEAEKSVYPEWAMRLVNHALLYMPEDKYLISKTVKLYLMMDRGKLVLPYLDQHLRQYQEDFTELKSVGDLLYKKGFYTQSIRYYHQAQKLRPGDAEVQSCLVLCNWYNGGRTEALDLLNELLESNKENPGILADGAGLLLNLGQKDRVPYYLNLLDHLSPSDPKVLKLKGMMAEQEGRLQEATTWYDLALKGDPEDLTTIRLLGNVLVQQKLWDRSIRHFRSALAYYPNEPYLLERLGTLLVSCPDPKLRNLSEGRDFSERAFIHTTSHSSTLISSGRSLAVAYAALGDYKNAADFMRMTIDLARHEKLPAESLAGLEKLYNHYRSLAGRKDSF
jgi:tetratricopeptide (TPR) repeat protein